VDLFRQIGELNPSEDHPILLTVSFPSPSICDAIVLVNHISIYTYLHYYMFLQLNMVALPSHYDTSKPYHTKVRVTYTE
jgi:hypothetical protein